jgi:DNA-binding transcriptional MerR regulator
MKIYTIGQFSKLINRTVRTLQKLDSENKFKAARTITGRRYYTEDQYYEFMGIKREKDKNA